jgi:hypothetical protein
MGTSLTGRQANVIDHALAYPKLTRNRFEAKNGSLNDETWKELVELGHAHIRSDVSVAGKTVYSVSESGIQAIHEYERVRPDTVDTHASSVP